jgi:hypothetical protein
MIIALWWTIYYGVDVEPGIHYMQAIYFTTTSYAYTLDYKH